MKIIFVNRFYYPDLSATSQLTTDLAEYLVSKGLDVHVVTSRALYNQSSEKLSANDTHNGVIIHRSYSFSLGRNKIVSRIAEYLLFYVGAIKILTKILNANDRLVIETDPPLFSVPASFLSQYKKALQVNWIQDIFPEIVQVDLHSPLATWFFGFLKIFRDRSYINSAMNVVLSDSMAENVRPQAIGPDKVKKIDNWSDGKQIVPIADEHNEVRKKLGLMGKFVVGYSGNMGHMHDFNTLIEAIKYSSQQRIMYLFIGGGKRKSELQRRLATETTCDYLFLDSVNRELLSQYLACIDFHLVTLLPQFEGLAVPSKFYGVLAAGKPVIYIGSKKSYLAKIINEYSIGFVVGIDEYLVLADILSTYTEKSVSYEQMCTASRNLFEHKYSKEIACEKWFKLLNEL